MTLKTDNDLRQRPVIFLVFAGNLPSLADEYNKIWAALKEAEKNGWCEVIERAYASIATIFDVFQDFRYQNRIAVFHFAGHADSWGLVLQDGAAHHEGLVPFLAGRKGLSVIFLNGCSTAQQARGLTNAGVPAVIGTDSDIADKVAADLAIRFYKGMAEGWPLGEAWKDAENFIKTNKENYPDDYRRVHWEGKREREGDFPWELYHDDKRPEILKWKLSTGDTLQVLREGSLKYFKALRSDTGRFRYLKISDILLPSTESRWLDSSAQVDQTPGGMLTREVLPFLWKRKVTHAVIVGDGGMGKTVSLIHWWEKLLEPVECSQEVTIPVYIALNEFNQVSEEKREGFILKMIRKQYGQDKVRPDQIEAMMKAPVQEGDELIPSLVLLLDGFNEITVEKKQLLLELNRLAEQCPGIQLVITSRYDMRGNFNWGHWNLVKLQELDEDKVVAYLQGKDLAVPKQERLWKLLHNPMMLTLYAASCEVQENHKDSPYCCFKDTVDTPGELLWNFMEAQVAKLPERLGLEEGKIVFYKFLLKFILPALAFEMEKAGQFEFSKEKMGNEIDKYCKRSYDKIFFSVFTEYKKNIKDLKLGECANFDDEIGRSESIINIIANELSMMVEAEQRLGFRHQDFRDFFAAVHMFNEVEISLKKNEIPGVLKERQLDYFVRRFMGEIEGEHRIKPYLVKEEGWRINIDKEKRLHRVLNLCRGKFGEEVGYTVWNIVTIWKEVRGELTEADLSCLDLSGIPFNGIRCSRFYDKGDDLDYRYLPAVFNGSRMHEKDLLPQGNSWRVTSAVYSPDGERILSASGDNTIKEWDPITGECLKAFNGHSLGVNSIIYNANGKRILSASSDKTIKEWDVNTQECLQTFVGHEDYVNSAIYSRDEERILSASRDGKIKEWDVKTRKCLKNFIGHKGYVNSAMYSHNEERILSAYSDGIKEWDTGTRKCLRTLAKHENWVTSAVYSKDGRKIVSASYDKKIIVWDAETGECLKTLPGHTEVVKRALFCDNGGKILSVSKDMTIKEWDTITGTCLKTFIGHSKVVRSAVYSPDEKRILSASEDKKIKEWDVETGQCLKTLTGRSRIVRCAVYSPDGKKILSAAKDNTIKEWDIESGKCMKIFTGHSDTVLKAVYTLDGKKILSISADLTIREWDAGTGEYLNTLVDNTSYISSAGYSTDRKKILSDLVDRTLKDWDVITRKRLMTYDEGAPSIPKLRNYNSIELGSDNTKIIVRGESNKIKKELPNVPGLLIQGCSFKNLEKGSQWTEEGLKILKQYNAQI